MSNIQTGAERMPHDLSHLGFLAGQIGRLITISTTPVIAGDSFEMDTVGALRLSPLRRGLAIDSTVDIFTFYVPHRHVYGEQWIKFMKDGVNANPLPIVNNTGYIDHVFFFQAEDGIRDFHVTGVRRVLFRCTRCSSTMQPSPWQFSVCLFSGCHAGGRTASLRERRSFSLAWGMSSSASIAPISATYFLRLAFLSAPFLPEPHCGWNAAVLGKAKMPHCPAILLAMNLRPLPKLFALLCLTLAPILHAQAGAAIPPAIYLYPNGAPGALGTAEGDKPRMYAFLPRARSTSAAILVIPGGGYENVAMGHEGFQIATWLNAQGMAAFVLDYRVAPYHYPVEIDDGRRAMRLIRAHAAEYGIDPKRIGVWGSSAGGHLASSL